MANAERAPENVANVFLHGFSRTGSDADRAGSGSVRMPVRSMSEITSSIRRSPVLSAVGQVEGFVDQRKIRHDVAEDGVLEQRPVLP